MKVSTHPLGTLIETDVLVIGSGASGCGAAIGAKEQGLDVVLMDKGKLESSGCIGGGNDHYMAIMDEKDTPFDSADDLVKFYAKPLNGWTPAMLTSGWYNHMRSILGMLEKGGVDFGKSSDGRYHRTQGFGQLRLNFGALRKRKVPPICSGDTYQPLKLRKYIAIDE